MHADLSTEDSRCCMAARSGACLIRAPAGGGGVAAVRRERGVRQQVLQVGACDVAHLQQGAVHRMSCRL